MKETKDKIILKALQYFAEHDYQSVSLNSIAEGIGITKGGIYHYFNSRYAIIRPKTIAFDENLLIQSQ